MAAVNYELTDHARVRMQERKIEAAWLERVIANPQRTEPDF